MSSHVFSEPRCIPAFNLAFRSAKWKLFLGSGTCWPGVTYMMGGLLHHLKDMKVTCLDHPGY